MLILYLLLPIVFYNMAALAFASLFPISSMASVALGAAVSFIVLYLYPYRRDQARRGILPPISFQFGGCLIILFFLGMGACVGINGLIGLTPLFHWSKGFKEASDNLYSPPLAIQLTGTVLVIPAAEEMVFRGLMFAPFRDRMGFWPAAVLSALLFGLYHGNVVQGIYAFLLGLVLAWLYERFRTLAAPWCFHAAANLTSVLAVSTGLNVYFDSAKTIICMAPAVIGGLIFAFCIFWITCKLKKRPEGLKEEEEA